MSFRCDNCNKVQPAYSKPIKVITETRNRIYPKRFADLEQKIVIDNGGVGTEVVKEVDLCQDCYQLTLDGENDGG